MIKLSLVKKFGIELVAGDVLLLEDGSPSGHIIAAATAKNFNKRDEAGARVITSFTPRLISDGIPTSIDGDVVLELSDGKGLVSFLSARNAAWHVWTTWRPSMEWLVQQAADKPVTYKDNTQHFGEDVLKVPSDRMREALKEADDISKGFTSRCVVMPFQDGYSVGYKLPSESTSSHEPSKPIFTQAMADAGELPPVGSLYLDDDGQVCSCLGYACNSNIIVGEMIEHPTINGIAPLSVCNKPAIKPLDTRTEKQKEVELALAEWPTADKSTLEFAYDYWLSGRKQ